MHYAPVASEPSEEALPNVNPGMSVDLPAIRKLREWRNYLKLRARAQTIHCLAGDVEFLRPSDETEIFFEPSEAVSR